MNEPGSGPKQDRVAEVFHGRRRYLLGVAYRLLGTVSEAEDAVQETWLRVHRVDPADIDDVAAWLTVVTTRICYDILKSARVRREHYVGQWLPEPLLDDPCHGDPADRITLDDSVRMALLVVLETLSPAERTAFVLHDIFTLPFDTIAEAVGRSPAACRQLAARARAHVAQRTPRFDTDHQQRRHAVEAFTHAAQTGDLTRLVAVLDPDVVLRSDGGGKVPARRTPLHGAQPVARFVLDMAAARTHMRQHPATVNGQPGLVTTEHDRTVAVMGFQTSHGRITHIDLVMNPPQAADLTDADRRCASLEIGRSAVGVCPSMGEVHARTRPQGASPGSSLRAPDPRSGCTARRWRSSRLSTRLVRWACASTSR